MEPAPCRQLRNEPSGDRPDGFFFGCCLPAAYAKTTRVKSDRQPQTDLEVDQAAVDEQFGAGGVGRIGGEVEGCCGDFGCGAGAAERNAGLGPLDEVVLQSRCQAAFVQDYFGATGLLGQYFDLVKIQFLASASVSKSPI
jgi:hypothetical protein